MSHPPQTPLISSTNSQPNRTSAPMAGSHRMGMRRCMLQTQTIPSPMNGSAAVTLRQAPVPRLTAIWAKHPRSSGQQCRGETARRIQGGPCFRYSSFLNQSQLQTKLVKS